MLRLDLARLGREGTVLVEARVPADDPLWQDVEVDFRGPVDVRLRASNAGSGEVVVRGTVEVATRQDCRRCLEVVDGVVTAKVTLVFLPSSMASLGEDGDDRVFADEAAELDLSEPVREELVFAIDPYQVCDPKCKGLCPQCGTNLNTDSCDCTTDERDSRWDVLRALKEE